jgi:bifunctional DNA-binding transcriptional regulator/antitoxin component of YhaV-PrlF toxin-antitoxin module
MPCQKAKYKIVCAESTLLKMDLLTLDQFGRLLIPNEIREQLGLTNTTQFTVVIQDGKLILEPLPQESKAYHSGTALVVESEPIGNLETALEDLREERIREFITSSENPV